MSDHFRHLRRCHGNIVLISEIAAWLFALFVVDPLHAEISERINSANLPIETIQQTQQCIATHAPRLLERAEAEPYWAIGTAVGIASGWTSSAELFDVNDPRCSALTEVFGAERGDDGEA